VVAGLVAVPVVDAAVSGDRGRRSGAQRQRQGSAAALRQSITVVKSPKSGKRKRGRIKVSGDELLDCLDHTCRRCAAYPARQMRYPRWWTRTITAWNDHDVDAILGLLADDATY
jgi:hypothetical protein